MFLGRLADASDACLVLARCFDLAMVEVRNVAVYLLGSKHWLQTLFGEAAACLETVFMRVALNTFGAPEDAEAQARRPLLHLWFGADRRRGVLAGVSAPDASTDAVGIGGARR